MAASPTARAFRKKVRAQGLRPVEIWVPDVTSPVFRAEAHRQSAAVAGSSQAAEYQAFVDAISERDSAT